jgi:hypothetical protein
VNLNFYIGTLLVFVVVMYAVRKLGETDSDYLLWRLTWFYYCIAFILSFYHEASGRLFYSLAIFYPILLARRYSKRIPIYALFLVFVLASNLRDYIRNEGESAFSGWELILYGHK